MERAERRWDFDDPLGLIEHVGYHGQRVDERERVDGGPVDGERVGWW